MQEKNIFQGYEVGNWDYGPRIYKIIVAAIVLTLLPIFALAQTNMLSTSACDSPFVGRVCDVLDTIVVGSKLLAKNGGYFDGEYEDIQLSESIWRDETNIEPQLLYPVGYFEIANRDELAALAALQDPNSTFQIPSTVPSVIPNLIAPPTPRYRAPITRKRGPIYPKKRDKVLDGDISDDPIGDLIAGNSGNKDGDKTSDGTKPKTDKTPDGSKTADSNKKPDNPLDKDTAKQSDPLTQLKINRKPLYDVADITLERVEANQVDLAQQFIVRMNGVVTPEGMLDEEKSGWGEAEGDERMIDLAKIAISKVGVSGWLKYLSDEDANQLNIMFGQNESQLVADVRSDLKDINKAKTTATLLRGLIQGAIFAHNNEIKELSDDELALLRAAKVTNEGQILVIKFNLDKELGQQIINTRLAEYKLKKEKEAKEKANEEKPNGSLNKTLGAPKIGK